MICPRCPPEVGEQSETNFGICRARKTGRNLYCKKCVNKLVQATRVAEKERLQARRQARAQPQRAAEIDSLEVRIKRALRTGPATFSDIRKEVGLKKGAQADEDLDAALANLQINRNEIRSKVINDKKYFALMPE